MEFQSEHRYFRRYHNVFYHKNSLEVIQNVSFWVKNIIYQLQGPHVILCAFI